VLDRWSLLLFAARMVTGEPPPRKWLRLKKVPLMPRRTRSGRLGRKCGAAY
jgi:hypothetical protein